MNLQNFSHRLTASKQLLLSVLWFALNFQSGALFAIVIPTQILLFVSPGQVGNVQQAEFLGWLSAGGSIIALLVPPLVGSLSDHTSSSWGRRRPYILVGTLITLLSVFMMASAQDIVLFVLGFLLFQAASNGCTAAYQSLLPDLVPEDQRGEASGYMGLMNILGNVGSLVLAAWLLSQVSAGPGQDGVIRQGAGSYYLITSIAMLVIALITVVGIHETPYTAVPHVPLSEERVTIRLQHWVMQNWIEPWRDYNFAWVFLTRCFVMMGLTLFMTFIEYYFANVEHITNFVQATAVVAVLALLGAVTSALALGILSDRIGRIMIVCIATICMALAALAFVLFPGSIPLWPLGILFGLGYGGYTSVDWALAVDSLPSLSTAGKDLGLWSIASNLPSVIAPLLGSIVITLVDARAGSSLGYRLVFALAVCFFVLGALFVLRIREGARTKGLMSPEMSAVERAEKQRARREAPRAPEPEKEDTPAPRKPRKARKRRQELAAAWKLAFRSRSGQAYGIMLFWQFWEGLTMLVEPIKPVPHAPYGLFGVRFKRYHGRPMDLPGGVHIQNGDRVGDLHFRNRAFMAYAAHNSPWGLVQLFRQEMQAFAQWAQEPDFPKDVQAFYGVTLLARAVRRIGFTIYERPKTLKAWLDRGFMTGLLVLYNKKGVERLKQGTTYGSYPEEVWITREELLRRYGTPPAKDDAPPTTE
jgi:MFS family permease